MLFETWDERSLLQVVSLITIPSFLHQSLIYFGCGLLREMAICSTQNEAPVSMEASKIAHHTLPTGSSHFHYEGTLSKAVKIFPNVSTVA